MKKKVLGIITALAIALPLCACGESYDSYSEDYTPSSSDSSYNYDSEDYNSSDDYGEGYGYDSSDPFYSANDHNHDGKLTDEEWQDAMDDAIDYYSDMLE